jgi:hypothetical protein
MTYNHSGFVAGIKGRPATEPEDNEYMDSYNRGVLAAKHPNHKSGEPYELRSGQMKPKSER